MKKKKETKQKLRLMPRVFFLTLRNTIDRNSLITMEFSNSKILIKFLWYN